MFSKKGAIRLFSRAELLNHVLPFVQYQKGGCDALFFEEYDTLNGVASCTPRSLTKVSCIIARLASCLSDHGANQRYYTIWQGLYLRVQETSESFRSLT